MKVYNLKLNPFRHWRILIKGWKTLTFDRIVNFIGVSIEAKLKPKKCKFKPYSAIIEPITTCNLTCNHCLIFQTEIGFRKELLDFELFKKFIDQNNQFVFLFFAGYGEPSLNPDLNKMILYAKSKNILTILASNGNLDFVKKEIHPDIVIFSIDYLDKKEYVANKGLDKLEISLKNVNNYYDFVKQKKMGVVICIQFLITTRNSNNLPVLKAMKKLVSFHFMIIKTAIIYNEKNLDLSVKKEEILKLPPPETSRCKFIYYSTKLNANGSLSLCCTDIQRHYDLGNIAKSEFGDLWNSETYGKIRELAAKNENLHPNCFYCPRVRDEDYFLSIRGSEKI